MYHVVYVLFKITPLFTPSSPISSLSLCMCDSHTYSRSHIYINTCIKYTYIAEVPAFPSIRINGYDERFAREECCEKIWSDKVNHVRGVYKHLYMCVCYLCEKKNTQFLSIYHAYHHYLRFIHGLLCS
jgi:hypothetical protein